MIYPTRQQCLRILALRFSSSTARCLTALPSSIAHVEAWFWWGESCWQQGPKVEQAMVWSHENRAGDPWSKSLLYCFITNWSFFFSSSRCLVCCCLHSTRNYDISKGEHPVQFLLNNASTGLMDGLLVWLAAEICHVSTRDPEPLVAYFNWDIPLPWPEKTRNGLHPVCPSSSFDLVELFLGWWKDQHGSREPPLVQTAGRRTATASSLEGCGTGDLQHGVWAPSRAVWSQWFGYGWHCHLVARLSSGVSPFEKKPFERENLSFCERPRALAMTQVCES